VGAIGWPVGIRFLTEEDPRGSVGGFGPDPSSITISTYFSR
jgi:hypothetical protein